MSLIISISGQQYQYSLLSVTFLSAALLSSLFVGYRTLSASTPRSKALLSPLKSASAQQVNADAYPPDIFPGSRDVSSPYGNLRVYEWGPENGRKVLLLHGISTPCLSLGGVAEGLVSHGCRVILFDLWGRGYSDCPLEGSYGSGDVPITQDEGLFTTAILIALASSPLSWSNFSLIGYSLGGGIAVAFASYFPQMVSSIILISPAGLIRPQHISSVNRFLYSSGLVPERLLEYVVRRRLRGGPISASAVKPQDGVNAEMPESGGFDQAILSKKRPEVTVQRAVTWQVDHHQGFTKAFLSSIRFGPISGRHKEWSKLGDRMSQRRDSINTHSAENSNMSQILIISGKTDSVIVLSELTEDAARCLGKENIRVESLDVGHELPITMATEVVGLILDYWSSGNDS